MITNLETTNIFLMLVALAIGLLIGVERGWRAREAKEGERIAGLRTFGLIGLLGGSIGLLTKQYGNFIFGLSFLGLCSVLIIAYAINIQIQKQEDISITSLIASLLTFVLGAIATQGSIALAGSIAVITTLLLGLKPVLHGWIQHLEQNELYAGLKLLLISVVLLSILPNQGFGPHKAFNPFEIWWLVVLMSSISFVAYFAIKIGGEKKGALFTAIFSGLISSTALTLHFSRLSQNKSKLSIILSFGILIACSMMFLRMLLFIAILNPTLLKHLALPSFLLTFVTILPCIISWKSSKKRKTQTESTPLSNPLELKPALIFGLLLSVTTLLSHFLKENFGELGLYSLAAITGFIDVDAIVLSYSRLEHIDPIVIARAIILAGCFNTFFKGILAAIIGGKGLLKTVTLPLSLTALVGISYTLIL